MEIIFGQKWMCLLPALAMVAGVRAQPYLDTEPLMRYGEGSLRRVAVSPAAPHGAVSGNVGISLWDLETGELLRAFGGLGDSVSFMGWSPDGETLAIVRSTAPRTLELRDARTGDLAGLLEGGHGDDITSFWFSPDGTRVITGSEDDQAIIWNLADGTIDRFLRPAMGDIYGVAWNPVEEEVVLASGNGSVTYDVRTGLKKAEFDAGLYVRYAPDGSALFFAGPASRYTPEGTRTATFATEGRDANSISIAPDGSAIAFRSYYNQILVYEAQAENPQLLTSFYGQGEATWPRWTEIDGSPALVTADLEGDLVVQPFPGGPALLAGRYDLLGETQVDPVFSPNGQMVLAHHVDSYREGSYQISDAYVDVVDARTGSLITQLAVERNQEATAFAFSPDGGSVVVSQDPRQSNDPGIVAIYGTTTGARMRGLAWENKVFRLAFSPDGQLVAGLDELGNVVVWGADTGARLQTFRLNRSERELEAAIDVSFSPDGRLVLAGAIDYGNDGRNWSPVIGVWNLETEAALHHGSTQFLNWLTGIGVSPDGQLLLLADGRSIYVRDLQTLDPVSLFTFSSSNNGREADFASGFPYVLTRTRGLVSLWDWRTGQQVRTLPEVAIMGVRGDGRQIAYVDEDEAGQEALFLQPTNLGARTIDITPFTNSVSRVQPVAEGEQAFTVGVTAEGRIDFRQWQTETGDYINLSTLPFSPDQAELLKDERTLAVRRGTLLEFYDLGALLASPAAAAKQHPRVRNTARTLIQQALGGTDVTGDGILDAADVLAAAELRESDLPPGPELVDYFDLSTQHTDGVTVVTASADGSRFLTGGEDGLIIYWDRATGAPISAGTGHAGDITAVDISLDGTTLLSASAQDGTARLWNSADGRQTVLIADAGAQIRTARFSPDATSILVASGNVLRLFSAATGTLSWEVSPAHTETILDATFSPNGAMIATASQDNTAKLFAAGDGTELRVFSGHYADVNAVSFAPSNDRLFSAGADGLTFLWDAGPQPEGGAPAPTIRTQDKILIVAGGGAYTGNAIASQTRALAEYAHYAAVLRGYDAADDIMYLSAFPDISAPGNPSQDVPNPRVDMPATVANLEDALRTWAQDARRLIIVLLDHGERAPDGETFFLMDATQSPREILSATALDVLLDEIQTGDDPLDEAIVYIDMCYAGGFLEALALAPTQERNRSVIASTAPDRLASFGGSNGQMSFSGFFFSALLQGNTFWDAYRRAREAILSLNVPASAPQQPLIDDDGDGRATLQDGRRLALHVLGAVPAFGNLPPEIISATPNTTLAQGNALAVEVTLGPGTVDAVRAFVIQASQPFDPALPITDFVSVDLQRAETGTRWSGRIPPSAFPSPGSYTVLYTASKNDPLLPELTLEAVPFVRMVTVEEAARRR